MYIIKDKRTGTIYQTQQEVMKAYGLSRVDVKHQLADPDSPLELLGGRYTPRNQKPPRLPLPAAYQIQPAPAPSLDIQALTELVQSLRSEVQSLRSEVRDLNDNALNLLTLPAGTQLNLPGVYY